MTAREMVSQVLSQTEETGSQEAVACPDAPAWWRSGVRWCRVAEKLPRKVSDLIAPRTGALASGTDDFHHDPFCSRRGQRAAAGPARHAPGSIGSCAPEITGPACSARGAGGSNRTGRGPRPASWLHPP